MATNHTDSHPNAPGELRLHPVDRVEIITLVDNRIDIFLPSTRVAERPPIGGERRGQRLLAENGFSAIVKASAGGETHTILFDVGRSDTAFFNNLNALGEALSGVEAIVLSHGHPDHFGPIGKVLEMIPKRPIPLILHPDAFLKRCLIFPDGERTDWRPLDRGSLIRAGADLRESTLPSLAGSPFYLVTGEIERTSGFERGFPLNYAEREGAWREDFLMRDDQGLVINLEGKGLVVISGCGHSGIVNTTLYAMKLTGISKVHTIMGGFHLTGPLSEPMIDQTVEEIKKIGAELVIPTHCTGFRGMGRFASEMPDKFILNSVGTKICL